ncbi:ras-related protein Rab-37 isoform X12 [Gallus gallus]|uniref:small monomeric GTPase n=1 Tax=Gallus gallus TaxID=9031 RepID=A0A8V1AN75_CHICK|nr:ras-related protein Rab-37 isoform X12 [Gallus gallus]
MQREDSAAPERLCALTTHSGCCVQQPGETLSLLNHSGPRPALPDSSFLGRAVQTEISSPMYRAPRSARGRVCALQTLRMPGVPPQTILVGDSGVGKTSLLVQFDQGKFIPGSFSATVGIGFTVMLLGDSGVGKTCFLLQFKDGAFLSGTFIATVGIDFRNKVVAVDGVKVKLQIWDTAGQERFRSVTHAYYRDAQALLLLYDITSKMSFDNIRAWLTEIHEYAQKDVVIMLLGNKADVSSERMVRTEDGASLAREYGVPFMETSAKTGMNVELAFLAIARELKQRAVQPPDEPRFQIHDYIEAQQKRSGCCAFI